MAHIFMGKNVHIIPTKQLLFVVAREVKTQTIEIWFGNVKNASKYAASMLKRGVLKADNVLILSFPFINI